MPSIRKRPMICALAWLLAGCASPSPKVLDLGATVLAPPAPAIIPPALPAPPSYSFQMRLQQIFDDSLSTPTGSPTTTGSATATPSE